MNEPDRPAPWFAERLPILQLITAENQYSIQRAHEGLYHWLAHYQQLMLLEAGVIGVVVPLLYAQGPSLIEPWFLRRAVLSLGVSLMVGVLICVVSKWVTTFVLTAVQQQFGEQYKAIGGAADEESAATSLQAVTAAFQPKAKRFMGILRAGIIGDVLFYGAFLIGVGFLMYGFAFSH